MQGSDIPIPNNDGLDDKQQEEVKQLDPVIEQQKSK